MNTVTNFESYGKCNKCGATFHTTASNPGPEIEKMLADCMGCHLDKAHRNRLLDAQKAHWKHFGGWVSFPADGNCFSCGYDLIANLPEERVKGSLISSCPRCSRSFVS